MLMHAFHFSGFQYGMKVGIVFLKLLNFKLSRREEGDTPLTLLYHFHPLHRHVDVG